MLRSVVRFAASNKRAKPARGWSVVSRDDVADIDRAHEDAHDRALHRLSQPIPRPAVDDSRPDFLIGVLQYRFGDRAQWRLVLGRELEVPSAAVALSLSWHGRLPGDFMRGIQKAIGVNVDARHVENPRSPFSLAAADSETAAEHRRESIDAMIAAINQRQVPDLANLGIVKAAPGDIVPRAHGGQTVATVADVLRAACGDRLVTCLCTAADLEWVRDTVAVKLRRVRLDLHIVVVDDAASPERTAIEAAMQTLVDDHAAHGRALPQRDLGGVLVRKGDRVPLTDVVRLPILCQRGVQMAVGRPNISAILSRRKVLHDLAVDNASIGMDT